MKKKIQTKKWTVEEMGLPDPKGRPQDGWPAGSLEEGAETFENEFLAPLSKHLLIVDSVWDDFADLVKARRAMKAARLNEIPPLPVPATVLKASATGGIIASGIPETANCYFRVVDIAGGSCLLRGDEAPGEGLILTWFDEGTPREAQNYNWSATALRAARDGKMPEPQASGGGSGGTSVLWTHDRLVMDATDLLQIAGRALAQMGYAPENYNNEADRFDETDPESVLLMRAQLPPARARG
jgi:hypothetical protein